MSIRSLYLIFSIFCSPFVGANPGEKIEEEEEKPLQELEVGKIGDEIPEQRLNIFKNKNLENLRIMRIFGDPFEVESLCRDKYSALKELYFAETQPNVPILFCKALFPNLENLIFYFDPRPSNKRSVNDSHRKLLEEYDYLFPKLKKLTLANFPMISCKIFEKVEIFSELKIFCLQNLSEVMNADGLKEKKYPKLTELCLWTVPKIIFEAFERVNFPELLKFRIFNTEISSLKSFEMISFEQLQVLHLMRNQISSIEALQWINLKHLETMDFSENYIVLFSISKLDTLKLTYLNISNNSIVDFKETPRLKAPKMEGFHFNNEKFSFFKKKTTVSTWDYSSLFKIESSPKNLFFFGTFYIEEELVRFKKMYRKKNHTFQI